MIISYKNDHWSFPTDHQANIEIFGATGAASSVSMVTYVFLLHLCEILLDVLLFKMLRVHTDQWSVAVDRLFFFQN